MMYHCPECATIIVAAESATRTDAPTGGLYLDTLYYNCPGCGARFMRGQITGADDVAVEQWHYVTPQGRPIVTHPAPSF